MKKTILSIALFFAISVCVMAEKREIHILSANDMHATIDNFPQLSAIVDSLRAIDPQLLVISAGDNRTGNPVNDQYDPVTYPMVSLMNFVGFDCSTFGNHEFDSRQEGLAKVINLSNFPYVCANVKADASLGINNIPYKIFNIDGITIGVLGVVQLGTHGIPDTHPDNAKGITFADPSETIRKYEWLTKKCDVNILLSHVGYEDDVKLAEAFPYYDLIIGGHSHTQLKGGELHNGVLVTQNVNKLKRVTYTTLTVEDGKVVKKEAKNIDVAHYPKKNKVVEQMVCNFNDNETFKRVLGKAETPFSSYEELGIFMSDAICDIGNAEIALWNAGGVRLDEVPAGDITVNKVLQLDPFGNHCIFKEMTGKEIQDMMYSVFANDEFRFPYTSSRLNCVVTLDPKDPKKIKKLEIREADGKKFDLKKTYKVVANSYTFSINDGDTKDPGVDMNVETASMIMKYLEKVGKVDYKGKTCQKIIGADN